ncbi:MAG: hypothetical protein M3Q19_04165 [Pseudomonadota bacterium]|nr:hypothetical protein [Pseudomonadota bacterium]
MTDFMTATLLMLASAGPIIAPIDETRFRVSIVYDDRSPNGHANAQISLMKAASKHCKGRGEAVSEGALELNKAEPLRPGKDALNLIEIYSCKPKS